MDQIVSFLKMGGYAGFVWPAYGMSLAVMLGFVIISLRTLRARQATLRALEASMPERPHRRRRGADGEAVPATKAKV